MKCAQCKEEIDEGKQVIIPLVGNICLKCDQENIEAVERAFARDRERNS